MQLSSAYHAMLRIRLLEERVLDCADRGLVAGFVHPSSGQEAVAVGVLAARRPQEWVVSFYRCHGHALAAGMSPDAVVREILGREGGACGGKGGSMHLADRGARFLGASSIVGSQLSIAAGVALAERGETEGDESEHDQSGRGVVVFCGDGAIGTGVAYETLTIAATLGLPLLVVCEDNGWQDHTPSALVRHLTPAECVRGLGIECAEVDGNDVVAVHAAAAALMDECRGRSAPRVLVARTYLKHFHAQAGVGRPAEYRPPDEIAYWSARDPLDIAARRIALHQAWFDDQRAQVERELDDVFDAALGAAAPDPACAVSNVTSAPHRSGASA